MIPSSGLSAGLREGERCSISMCARSGRQNDLQAAPSVITMKYLFFALSRPAGVDTCFLYPSKSVSSTSPVGLWVPLSGGTPTNFRSFTRSEVVWEKSAIRFIPEAEEHCTFTVLAKLRLFRKCISMPFVSYLDPTTTSVASASHA